MKDLENMYFMFGVLKAIMYVILGLLSLGCVIGLVNGSASCVISFLGLIVWVIAYLTLRIYEIVLTRFVAMSENVLEITEMLEKKIENNN